MKCIQDNKTGEIRRVENKMADNMVGSQWKYISKSEWKNKNYDLDNIYVMCFLLCF